MIVIKNENSRCHTAQGQPLPEQEKRAMTPAMEKYLETIYKSSLKSGFTRVGILAGLLNVHPSSATKMVRRLSDAGMLKDQKYGVVVLTEKGRHAGKFLSDRRSAPDSQ